jgi:hypothetical protein
MTICPSIAADSLSARSIGASSSSFGVKGSIGCGSTASALQAHLRTWAAAQEAARRFEHHRWADMMARDHALLRLLLERFEQAEQPRAGVMLLRLALDFHDMHSVFELNWMKIPALGLARLALDDLAEQIECTAPLSALHRARGLHWKGHLIHLMRKEEVVHREIMPKSGLGSPWSEDLMRWRMSLGFEMRSVLTAELIGLDGALELRRP